MHNLPGGLPFGQYPLPTFPDTQNTNLMFNSPMTYDQEIQPSLSMDPLQYPSQPNFNTGQNGDFFGCSSAPSNPRTTLSGPTESLEESIHYSSCSHTFHAARHSPNQPISGTSGRIPELEQELAQLQLQLAAAEDDFARTFCDAGKNPKAYPVAQQDKAKSSLYARCAPGASTSRKRKKPTSISRPLPTAEDKRIKKSRRRGGAARDVPAAQQEPDWVSEGRKVHWDMIECSSQANGHTLAPSNPGPQISPPTVRPERTIQESLGGEVVEEPRYSPSLSNPDLRLSLPTGRRGHEAQESINGQTGEDRRHVPTPPIPGPVFSLPAFRSRYTDRETSDGQTDQARQHNLASSSSDPRLSPSAPRPQRARHVTPPSTPLPSGATRSAAHQFVDTPLLEHRRGVPLEYCALCDLFYRATSRAHTRGAEHTRSIESLLPPFEQPTEDLVAVVRELRSAWVHTLRRFTRYRNLRGFLTLLRNRLGDQYEQYGHMAGFEFGTRPTYRIPSWDAIVVIDVIAERADHRMIRQKNARTASMQRVVLARFDGWGGRDLVAFAGDRRPRPAIPAPGATWADVDRRVDDGTTHDRDDDEEMDEAEQDRRNAALLMRGVPSLTASLRPFIAAGNREGMELLNQRDDLETWSSGVDFPPEGMAALAPQRQGDLAQTFFTLAEEVASFRFGP